MDARDAIVGDGVVAPDGFGPPSDGLCAPRRRCEAGEALPGRTWAVVLAGGDGRRVSALTRGAAGEPVPKQYCALGRNEPLVRQALRRAAAVVSPERVLVVVAEQHRRLWSDMLADVPAENIVVQPRNRGTAAGILLPVLQLVLTRDRQARVLILPADHHVDREGILLQSLLAATRGVRRPDAKVVLLGMPGEHRDGEYGWILPTAGPAADPCRVLAFAEKPDQRASRQLEALGALVSSFIFVAPGRRLIQLFEDTIPELLRSFVPVVLAGCTESGLRDLYNAIPSRDFSRDVLEKCVDELVVLAVPPCGWSDLGTPSRIRPFLQSEASQLGMAVRAAVAGSRSPLLEAAQPERNAR